MVSLTAALTEEHYQRLWQPPVPPQVLQFIAASAAVRYTAEKALGHIEEGKSELGELGGLEQAVEGAGGLLAAPVMTFRERKALQGISEFRAMAEGATPFYQQLTAFASQAQEFFGARVECKQQPYSVEVTVQTPLGQRHVFSAPGANISAGNGSWHDRSASIASIRYLVQAELGEALSTGQAALQHAVDRLGAEPSQPLRKLMKTYTNFK